MNVQSKTVESRLPTTADEFMRWNEGRDGKREFVAGRVVELVINTTRNHATIAARMIMALGLRLNQSVFDVGSADFAVRTPLGVRYPDVYVDRRSVVSRGTDLAASAPVLLVEVLSASSYTRDFVEKLSDYAGIAALNHYLILSQEEPHAWLWSRIGLSDWDNGVEIVGLELELKLVDLGISIPLSELYAGLDTTRL